MNCYYHDQDESETRCSLCNKNLCMRCINPEDGYCWSCSHDVNSGLHQAKANHRLAKKRFIEYLYCFFIYEISYLLISFLLGRLSPIVIAVEAPFIIGIGIPVSIFIEWVIEAKASKLDYKLKYIIGLVLYTLSALFFTIFIFGIDYFDFTSVLTISVSLSIFFILRILRSNHKRSIIVISVIGYFIVMFINFLTIESNHWL